MTLAAILMILEITFKVVSVVILLERLFDRYLDYKLTNKINELKTKSIKKTATILAKTSSGNLVLF